MATMNVSLPETLKDFVDNQVHNRGYSTSSEYIRDLIRNDQIHLAEQQLAKLILGGLESGAAVPVSTDYWDNKQAKLRQRNSAQ
jgi:antitoxin ParD1/3/4